MSEENFEQRAQLYKKLNAFRADVIQCDWKDDKMVSLGGKGGYPYLSSDKIIKNLAPLLVKHGIELDVEYSELTNYPKDVNHWSVKATIFLTDVDTGYTATSCAYGEGSDSQDKGIAKAQTAAFKKCLSARNMIADGIDPDAVDITPVSNYYRRSAEEQEEVKSKVLANAVKPEAKAETKTEKPPFKNLEESAKVFPPKEEPKEEKPKFEPTAVQKKVLSRITQDYEELAKNGGIDVVEYNDMLSAYMDINSPQAVKAFIDKYRRTTV